MAGRKSKYTDELVNVLLGCIANGMTDGDACLVAGIDESTFYDWQNKKPEFSDRVKRARPSGWLEALRGIRAAGKNGDWRAWAEYLDRTRSPYRKSQTLDINITTLVQEAAEQLGLDDDERAALAADVQAWMQTQKAPAS